MDGHPILKGDDPQGSTLTRVAALTCGAPHAHLEPLLARIARKLRDLFRAPKESALEGPEVHHPHARHGGLPRWLELGIALTALITSVSSIIIAIHHGQTMEKLVEANSLPYMQGGISDVTTEGEQILSLDLLNRGVGPAHEKSLRVKADGRYVTSLLVHEPGHFVTFAVRSHHANRMVLCLRQKVCG